MVLPSGSLPRVLLAMFVLEVCLAPIQCAYGSGRAPTSSNESQQAAQVSTFRCEFPIRPIALSTKLLLDEIEDVTSANGKSVEVVLKGKTILIRTPKGRKLRAHLVDGKKC
jgi:hypothetical protein